MSNGGALWTPINAALSATQIRALAVDPKNPGVVYAGTALGWSSRLPTALELGRQQCWAALPQHRHDAV
jgi:hypothetical protein